MKLCMKTAWVGLLCVLAGCVHASVVLQDDRGREVRMAQAPKRIVSLLPSLTETVCALGACERLVGVDRYANWPASVQRLPRVGGGLDPSIEAIVALRPDVVLMATSSRASDRLEALGLKVVALEPKTHDDVARVMSKVAQVLGLPAQQGLQALKQIDDDIAQAAQRVPASLKGVKVYFEVNRGPYAAGTTSFIGETLSRLGLHNVVGPELGPFPKLNPEYVVRADPQFIMIGARHAAGLAERPGWAQMRAMRQNKVCVFSPEQADTIIRPGPRMATGAHVLVDCLLGKVGGLS